MPRQEPQRYRITVRPERALTEIERLPAADAEDQTPQQIRNWVSFKIDLDAREADGFALGAEITQVGVYEIETHGTIQRVLMKPDGTAHPLPTLTRDQFEELYDLCAGSYSDRTRKEFVDRLTNMLEGVGVQIEPRLVDVDVSPGLLISPEQMREAYDRMVDGPGAAMKRRDAFRHAIEPIVRHLGGRLAR